MAAHTPAGCNISISSKLKMANFCGGIGFQQEKHYPRQAQSQRYGSSTSAHTYRPRSASSTQGVSGSNFHQGPPNLPTPAAVRGQGEGAEARVAIRDVTPHQANTVIIGIVVTKQRIHSFPDKKNPGCERCKFTFTLRDSPSDYINATCWGSDEHVRKLHKSFKICDVVELQNGQISSKMGGGDAQGDKWSPWTPSQYQINISETYSTLSLYSGWDYTEFTALAHIPLRPPNDYYTLSDVVTTGQSLDGSHINILAIVKHCCSVKEMTSKTGKPLKKCDIHLMDESCTNFLLVVWDEELIELAQTWTPRENIISAVDVKVTYDTYRNTMIATCGPKTIITTNPDCQEAHHLYQYAQTLDMSVFQDPGQEFKGHGNDTQDDIETISRVYTVEEIKVEKTTRSNDFTGILYPYLSSFNIDQSVSSVVCFKCSKCRYRVDRDSTVCPNKSCSHASDDSFTAEPHFNILVSLTDCTGTIESVVLAGVTANNLLMCSPTEFLGKVERERTELKSGLLLEKFKVYFKCISDQRKVSVRVLSMCLADPKDMNISR